MYICVIRVTIDNWTILVIIQWDVTRSYNISIIFGRIGCTALNGKRRPVRKPNSIFKKYNRQDKESMTAQKGSFFASGLCMLQMAMPTKYGECGNYDKLHLHSLFQCVPLRCSEKTIKLGPWTRKKERFPFSWCNHKEFGAPIRSNSFEVVVSTQRRKMLSRQENSNPRMQNPKLVVVCAIQVEQHYKPPKPDVGQRSFLCSRLASKIFFQIVLKQMRCWRVPRRAFIDPALVYYSNNGVGDRVPKSPVCFRTELISPGNVDCIKRNSSKRLFVGKVARASSYVGTLL